MSIQRALYRIGLERGVRHEERALQALETFRANWISSVRRASDSEERRGIDIVIETDVGKLFLQIKSSWRGLHGHKEKHGRSRTKIICIIVNEKMDNEQVANIVRGFVKRAREDIVSYRQAQWK